MLGHIQADLNLTPAQATQVEEMQKAMQAQHAAHFAQHQTQLQTLAAEVKKDKLDPKALEAMANLHATHNQEHAKLMHEHMTRLHASLSKEQKEKLSHLMLEMSKQPLCPAAKGPAAKP